MLSLIYAPCLLWCCISSTLQFFSLLYELCLINYINVKIFQTMIVARFHQLNEHVLLQLWRKRSNPAQGTYTQETWLTAGILLHCAVIFTRIHIFTFYIFDIFSTDIFILLHMTLLTIRETIFPPCGIWLIFQQWKKVISRAHSK